MRTRTKIICTIGPSVASLEGLALLIDNGMDVARLNFGHGTHDEHRATIALLKQAREICKRPLAIMIDIKGPEIRVGSVMAGGISVAPGDRLLLVKEAVEGTKEKLMIRQGMVLDCLHVGADVLIDNGYIQSKVVDISPEGVTIEFTNGGTILSSKGVNIPGLSVPLPSMTEKDKADIQFGCEEGVDMIAASFIRCGENILDIKRLLAQYRRSDMQVLAKIENAEGVTNFDEILRVSDGIMVARGDLGVEVPLYEVPNLQKMMIKKCNMVGKPVVTATQMLESMMNNPRPTRAEVSDVANAIYDGSSAVMLSGETAAGAYPQETVKMMHSVIAEAEKNFDYETFFDMHEKLSYRDIPSAITLSAVKTAYCLGAKAIVTFSHSGATVRLLSRLKPKMAIIALTLNEFTYHQMAVCWGVTPVLCDTPCSTMEEAFSYASTWCLKHGLVTNGDLVVLTAGSPFWVAGTSNTILVDTIGEVLVKGSRSIGEEVCGMVSFVQGSAPYHERSILVLSTFGEAMLPLLQDATGVILAAPNSEEIENRLLEVCGQLNITALIGAENVVDVLRDKQVVTIDPRKALVYKGSRKV